MKKRFKIEIMAFLLAAIMFVQSLPMNVLSAFADEIAEMITSEETIEHKFSPGNMVDMYNIGNGNIIRENVENRTLTTKEYLMSDNTIMVQQFVEPVHYFENGEYKEIDNSLQEETKEGQKVYKNKANSFKVTFYQDQSSFVEIEED